MTALAGFHSETELARRLGLSVWALRAWRRRNYGPPAIKIGRSVYYRTNDVDAFLEDPSRPL